VNEIVSILPSQIARRFNDLVKRNRDATVKIFHEINLLNSKFLTTCTVVGGHCRVEIKLHEGLFLYHLITISSEVLTSPDCTEGLGIHATIEQHINIGSIFNRDFALCVKRIDYEGTMVDLKVHK